MKEPFVLLLTCRDEKQQVELLERFLAEGLECKALVSEPIKAGHSMDATNNLAELMADMGRSEINMSSLIRAIY